MTLNLEEAEGKALAWRTGSYGWADFTPAMSNEEILRRLVLKLERVAVR